MKKFLKIIPRIIFLIILLSGIAGLTWYEISSINQKERDRQYIIYNEAKKDLTLNLNLVKVAILTKDAKLYDQSIKNIDSSLQTVNKYSIIRTEQAATTQRVLDYSNLLKSRQATLTEMVSINDAINLATKTVGENFGDANALSRDSLRNASAIVSGLKIPTENYNTKTSLAVAEKVNQILAKMEDSANKLSACIDTCYQENIVEISNDMSNSLGTMVQGFPELNQAFIAEFQLDRLAELIKSLE